MAGAFTQLHVHAVTVVKFRQAMINPAWERELFNVMADALRELGHHPIIMNGTPDHVHLLWDHKRTETIARTMKIIKGRSSKWINDARLTDMTFRWQPGYGAFAVSISRVPGVTEYIRRQKDHHGITTLHQEYEHLLNSHGVQDTKPYMFSRLSEDSTSY